METSNTAVETQALPAAPAAEASLAEWALWNAEIGRITGAWRVFPCVPGGKRPLHTGWQDEAASDPKNVATMWQNEPAANVGLAIQPGFVVIDGDLYKPGAEAALVAFEAEHGELPRTFEQNTPSGGIHLLYTTTKTLGNGKGSLPNFGDVRGAGGLIVGPGSIFNGKCYTVENLAQPAPLPTHIEAMLVERVTRDRSKPDAPARFVVVDDPHNVQAFTDWCAGKSVRTIATPNGEVAEPCVENQGGNNKLAATGAMAHDYGLSDYIALKAALQFHNPRCEPPWDADVYEKHFLSGYRSAEGQLGCRAPSQNFRSLFTAQSGSPQAATDLDARIASFAGGEPDEDEHQPEMEFWDAEKTMPHFKDGAVAEYYGAFGAMKTTVVIADCLDAIAKGARVIFGAGEGRYGIGKKRLPAACAARGITTASLRGKWKTAKRVPVLTDQFDVGAFITYCQQAFAPAVPDIVTIDTLATASGSAEENSDAFSKLLTSNGAVGRIKNALCGSLIIVLHHSGKTEGKSARGHSGQGGNVDVLKQITADKDARTIKVHVEKMRDAEDNFDIAYQVTPASQVPVAAKIGRVSPASPAAAAAERDIHARFILAALRHVAGKKWSLNSLAVEAKHTGCTLSLTQLRQGVLGPVQRSGVPGWATTHPALIPYYDKAAEQWITPGQLPAVDPEWELREDEKAKVKSEAPVTAEMPSAPTPSRRVKKAGGLFKPAGELKSV